jgi:large conductance mechanosensitive channel protein
MAKRNRSKTTTATAKPNAMAGSSTVRFKQADTRDRSPKQNHLTLIFPDELVGGFFDFIRSHAIISLAVGFVIATQVQTVVKQLVSSFITPTFQLFFKGTLLKDSWKFHFNGHEVVYNWGIFANDLVDFIFVLAVIYLIIRFFKLERLEKPKTKKS